MRGEASRPGKRPARNLSAAEKLEIIQRVHDGESKASVARNIGVPESTLRGWCKTELKLRSMTRNSSTTPDSEAHSSSGSNHVAGPSHLSSDEELDGLPSAPKRRKEDLISESNEAAIAAAAAAAAAMKQQTSGATAGYDYAAHLLSAMMGSAVRGNDASSMMLMQQMGLLTGMQGNIAQIMNMPAFQALTGGSSASTVAASASQSVGLVENGLQYSKSSAGTNSAKHQQRHSTSGHVSSTVVAPSRHDSIPKRNSLPPAAEAPLTISPVSPRKTSEHNLSNNVLQKHQQLVTSARNSSSKRDDGVRPQQDVLKWLEDQHQAAAVANSDAGHNKSAFYNWYKKDVMSTASRTSTSPTKAKAILDNVLLCNNNENGQNHSASSANIPVSPDASADSSSKPLELRKTMMTTEEAMDIGQKFYDWLERCGDPTITRVQMMNLEQILQNIKSSQQNRSSRSLKQSRK